MAKDARSALQHFIAALENHYSTVTNRREGDNSAIERSYDVLQDAFMDYEEALQDTFEEYLPFELSEDD